MKNEIREMLKTIIQENAVDFKTTTSNVLYGKIANRLQEEYKTTAKKFFSVNEEKLDENIFQKVKNFVSGEGFRSDEQRDKSKAWKAKRDAEHAKFVADTPAREAREKESRQRAAAEDAARTKRIKDSQAKYELDRKIDDEIRAEREQNAEIRRSQLNKPTTDIWEI